MAFTATTPTIIPLGPGSVLAVGTYANTAGSTGGSIVTGLGVVNGVILTPKGAAVVSAHTYNVTLPLTGISSVVIVTGADESGTYMIYGTF